MAGSKNLGAMVVNNYSNSEATVTERTTGNGRRVFEVLIQAEVDQGLAVGKYDRSLQSRFNLRPVGRAGA